MPNLTAKKRTSPFKLAAIPILGLVLLKSLLGGGAEDEEPASEAQPASAVHAAKPQAGVESVAPRRQRPWPRFPLQAVLKHNPFTLNGDQPREVSLAEKQAEAKVNDLVLPEQRPVSLYLRTGNRELALVEGRVLQWGDVVDEKWKVGQLNENNVVLVPRDEQPIELP